MWTRWTEKVHGGCTRCCAVRAVEGGAVRGQRIGDTMTPCHGDRSVVLVERKATPNNGQYRGRNKTVPYGPAVQRFLVTRFHDGICIVACSVPSYLHLHIAKYATYEDSVRYCILAHHCGRALHLLLSVAGPSRRRKPIAAANPHFLAINRSSCFSIFHQLSPSTAPHAYSNLIRTSPTTVIESPLRRPAFHPDPLFF